MEHLQEILDKYGIKCDINMIIGMWNESHRHYHNLDHLIDLIEQIDVYLEHDKISSKEYEILMISAIFHDIVYDPIKHDNEEKSAEFFISCCVNKNSKDIIDIKNIILDTKDHDSDNYLSSLFNKFDMSVVERDFDSLLEWENGIHDEYKEYGDFYKIGRLKFLQSLLYKYPDNYENISKLIEWVEINY